MYTIVETPIFTADAKSILTEDERGALCARIADAPLAGDVVPGSGGCRKMRWQLPGRGKSGGARVIYYNQLGNGIIWLLVIYAKAVRGNIPAHLLKAIKESIEND
jgi:hypothetical protein